MLSFFFLLSFYLTPITSNDFWIQLKVGQLIKEDLEIPKTILFTFTHLKDKAFLAHEWFPSLVFALFYDALGYNFMIIFKFLLYFSSFLLAFNLSQMMTKNILYSFFISLVILFVLNCRSFLRPEAFSYILLLAELNVLFLFKQNENLKYLMFYLILNIIWVNSHGSFLVSLGLPFLFAFSEMSDVFIENCFRSKKHSVFKDKEKKLFLLGLLAIVTSLINPLGFELLLHSYELSQDSLLKETIFEWRPMLSESVRRSSIFKVFLFFISVLSFFTIFRFHHLKTFGIALLVIFTYLTFEAQRHLAFLAISSVWPLSQMLKEMPLRNYFSNILAFCIVFTLPYLSWHAWNKGNAVGVKPGFYYSARMPEHSLEAIRKMNLSGNTLNTYTFGGQLIFHFYPKLHVGIDSRIDAYGVEYARRYNSMIYGRYKELKNFLDLYNVQNIIVDSSAFNRMQKTGSSAALTKDGWELVYKSEKVVVMKNSRN